VSTEPGRIRGIGARGAGIGRAPIIGWLGRAASSSWTLGLVVGLLSWKVLFATPAIGLDNSWQAALYMASHRGLHFGTQVVFTYGPLGFLNQPFLWYSGLAAIAFVYQVALHLALGITLLWALRRTLSAPIAVVLTAVVLIAAPGLDVPISLTAVWCLLALSPEPPSRAPWIVLIGGVVLGAAQTLVEWRSGPVILVMCAITLLASRQRWRNLALFIVGAVGALLALWFLSGQGVGNISGYLAKTAQIVSGYSEAMGLHGGPALVVGALALGAGLTAVACLSSRPGATRLAAGLVIALASFAVFKEAVVRADFDHSQIFFGTAAGVGAAVAYERRRTLALLAVVGLAALNLGLEVGNQVVPTFNPIAHIRAAASGVRLLFSPGRRSHDTSLYAQDMRRVYRLSPATLRLLRGRTVYVAPWEEAAAWAYGLRWDPPPVFQNYSAYTAALDRLNANALRSPSGPQRILRENTLTVNPRTHSPAGVDRRWSAWDPPGQSLAMFCNYAPLLTTPRWQVLGKVASRCGPSTRVGSRDTRYGVTVRVPEPAKGRIVYAKVHGAGVSGLERIRTLLYRADVRHVVVNGTSTYRLVPGTAADGLIMDMAPGVDYPGPSPFRLSPGAHTIRLTGQSGALTIEFFSMVVRGGG
jgi:hypothetical protein